MSKKRITKQQRIIENICFSDSKARCIKCILEVGKKSLDSLNLSTVYRHLNQLVGSGRMIRINHPEKGVLYEQANLPHHHHFFCKSCNITFEIPCCGLDEEKIIPAGFKADSHEIYISGLCSACAS